ncbi:MAG: ribosome recycling factor [Gloeomargarita sp. SKYBB_i_bin120]|nr:ribosome recycling factor [Gloeomargarita sp. SKYG98]MCS7292500.1 ribosome recycling factor [Gloeomargarita sp. SKYB120]MDW8178061.1 ribosome recycling factor [Gloeomargarita sp. SKYBB_i_bin120]
MNLSEVETKMQQTLEATQRSFNTIRTGRANAAILDRVMVDYYNVPTPLRSLASISTPDATTILIQPYDRSTLGAIEKAISTSDVGLTPNNDGNQIRLNIPPLTAERRKELVKSVHKLAEEGKVALRNIRREAIEQVRKQEKAAEISKDEAFSLQESIQKLTDKYIAKIDEMTQAKEKEILTV